MKNLLKRLSAIMLMALFAIVLFSCQKEVEPAEPVDVSKTLTQPDFVIDGSSFGDSWAYVTYSLKDYADQKVTINFSAEMKVTNNSDKTQELKWQVNTSDYPMVAYYDFPAGVTDWLTVEGANEEPIQLGANDLLYLSTYETEIKNLKIEVRNIKYTVSYTSYDGVKVDWMDESVPSVYETYKDNFDYVGFACEYSSDWSKVYELSVDSVCKGLKKHGNTITMGNEFKPDGFFGWQWSGSSSSLVDFKASNGLTIKVPKSLNYGTIDKCLSQCKKFGLKMRGHVLVWHSQTPDNFFAQGYNAKYEDSKKNVITNLVSKDEMDARQEWYIKTVLAHVADWEAKNNNGEHIIWAWDVVNEAAENGALRGATPGTKDKNPSDGGSRWYQIYGSEEFIVNAFRYANAYAPADVKLCYNDFNEWYTSWSNNKPDTICKLIDSIKKGEAKTINGVSVKPRIDAMGMQSHVGLDNPGVNNYEKSIKKYLAKGVDIHVTEFDINANSKSDAAKNYKKYFELFQKYGNQYEGSNKIECVTIWGINNKTSWIYNKDSCKYPLLFDNFNVTDSYWGVINAHK